MTAASDIFKKIFDSKASAGGNIIRDGRYVHEVQNILMLPKHKGLMFICEFVVVKAEVVDVDDSLRLLSEMGKNLLPNKEGTDCSFVINLTTNHESGPGNVKGLMLALDGSTEDEIEEEAFIAMLKQATGPDQPFRGVLVGDLTFRKLIQKGVNKDKPFTAHRWSHIAQATDEVRARRVVIEERLTKKALEPKSVA